MYTHFYFLTNNPPPPISNLPPTLVLTLHFNALFVNKLNLHDCVSMTMSFIYFHHTRVPIFEPHFNTNF